MGGLLARVVGGALTGAGAAMVDQAKQQREDALLALKRGQEVEDRNAGYAQQDKTVATQQQGETDRTNLNNQTSRDNTKANNDTSITVGAANNATSRANNADTEKGANSRNAATIGAQKDIAKMRTDSYNKKTEAVASQYGTGKTLTWNQALTTARQAYKDNSAAFTDADGTPTPPDKAIADIAASLMTKQPPPPTSTTIAPGGPALGGLMDHFDANSAPLSFPTGGGLVRTPGSQSAVMPPPAPASFDTSKATATATNPKTGAKIFQIGGQWVDGTGKPAQ